MRACDRFRASAAAQRSLPAGSAKSRRQRRSHKRRATRAISWTLLAGRSPGRVRILGVERLRMPAAEGAAMARRMLRLQENVIPSQGDFRIDTRPSNQGAIRDHPGHRCALRALCAEHGAHRCSIAVFRAWHVAPVRLAVAAADPRAALDVLVRRRNRARRWRAARARSFHSAGGTDHVRGDGLRLFHQPMRRRAFSRS
jgi:hypothetical protein